MYINKTLREGHSDRNKYVRRINKFNFYCFMKYYIFDFIFIKRKSYNVIAIVVLSFVELAICMLHTNICLSCQERIELRVGG